MKAYDMEMTRLFEKARRYYQRVTQPYGHVLAIQRLYNALTSMYESQDIEQGTPPPSALSYASFPAGPGNAKPLGDNGVRNDETKEFTSFRIVHLPTHLFYEDEVFKTGHMVDHPVEDIMERVGCQFFTKELRKSDFMQVTTFEKAPHTLRLYKSPFLLGTQPGTRGVTGYLSDTVGQTPTEKKGLRGDSATGDDEAAHPGMTPNPSTERAAKKARIEEKSPLGVHANPHMQSEQGSSHPSMIGPTSTIAAQISMSTGPSTGHAPTGSSGIPGFSTPGASRQLPATAAVSGYNAQADNRGPPTPQSPFGGPHQIVPLNRSNPLPYQPQMMSNLPNLQPPRQINLPATGQPRPQGYSHAPGGFSLNTHPIKPISNTQPSYQYHAQTPGQGVPARSQLPPHGQAQGSVPPVVQVANVATPRGADKSLATLFGGPQELDRLCDTEMLPESTVNMLDRDPVTNRVFWFSGPPIHVDVPEKPKHSATYLAHLAQNRLRFALGQMMDPGTAAGEGEVVASADIVEEGKGQWSAVAEEVAHFMNAE
ncbi:hypothetical protein QFC19_007331 [Naganishia cerealis]|uniref:Uncharacterized protein n=1 Tax=Naganishia cerealis TaxID=610337 RepID=A0ACC2VB08_9TREE|nr:hypothetical protein QFC19_007331 [Naganishia cerealis]